MPIITFWSNKENSIGQTVATTIAATVTGIEHNYKVLLISADFNDKMIEKSFGAQESNNNIVKGIVNRSQMSLDSGIQGLLKLADSNRVTPEVIQDYTKIVFKNRLEVLKGIVEKLNNVGNSKNIGEFKDKQQLNNHILKNKINELIDVINNLKGSDD